MKAHVHFVACLAFALAISACGKNHQNDPNPAPAKTKILSPCEKEKLVAVNYDSPSFQCSNAGSGGTGKLVAEGIDISLGRSLDQVVADAKKAGANVTSGNVTTLAFVTEYPSDFGGPDRERRTYLLKSRVGKVVGLKACETYFSGLHRRRLMTAMVEAFGAPTDVRSEITSAHMSWPKGQWLMISGSPNIVRVEEGDIAETDDRDVNRRIFNEVIKAEDRMPYDIAGARSGVAMRYCMTDNELKSIMVPMLNRGVQPDE